MAAAILATALPATAQLIPNLGGQRVGISSYQFLKIGVGARGVALGESFIAVANDASALYWNPAGLTQFGENQAIAAHTFYVLDMKHDMFGAVYHLSGNDAVGVALSSLTTDDMEITTETQPLGTGRYFSYGDVAFGLSYARKMTDQFSFGITVRYVSETLDMLKMNGVMTDLGTYYWTGLGSTRFAVVISNFGPDVAPSGETALYNGTKVTNFQSFSPPTQFKFGLAFDPYESDQHQSTISFAWLHPNDNTESMNIGAEYRWQHLVSLRAGVRRAIGQAMFGADQTNVGDLSLGFGVVAPVSGMKFNFDYAYTDFNLLGNLHRISVMMAW
jgi:long-subunit fatty acid transport protein